MRNQQQTNSQRPSKEAKKTSKKFSQYMLALCHKKDVKKQKAESERNAFDLTKKVKDLTKLTPYELMRMQNCKTFRYNKCDAYPNIRPSISQCSTVQTAQGLVDTVEPAGCGGYFDMEKDDVLEVWKRSPKKQTLSYYGIISGIGRPETFLFNQAVCQSLSKASGAKSLTKSSRKTCGSRIKAQMELPPKVQMPFVKEPCATFFLNRGILQAKLAKMPTVKRELSANRAFDHLYCPSSKIPHEPFVDKVSHTSVPDAQYMKRARRKPKRVLKCKHKYCELQCNMPENKCTEDEWLRHSQDAKAYGRNILLQGSDPTQVPEPKNFDELYKQLITCFQKIKKKDSLCIMYDKCCKPNKAVDGGGDCKRCASPFGDDGKTDDHLKKDFSDQYHSKNGGSGDHLKKDKDRSKKRFSNKGKGKRNKKSNKKDYDKSEKEKETSDTQIDYSIATQSDQCSNRTSVESQKEISDNCIDDRECPCDICQFMKRHQNEVDSPLIRKLKLEENRRKQREYLKWMCHRQYMKSKKLNYRAPQHKCNSIACDNFFCYHPRLVEFC